MKHGIFNALRAFFFIFLIALVTILCVLERDSSTPSVEPQIEAESANNLSDLCYTEDEKAECALLVCFTEPKTSEPLIIQKKEEPPTEDYVRIIYRGEINVIEQEEEPTGEWISLGTFELTAYCSCESCCDHYAVNRPIDKNGKPVVYTATGTVAKAGRTIAVDPSIIPHGTEVNINDHIYIAEDAGAAIVGNRIDVYFADHGEALVFGRQSAEVQIKAAS